jgi:hypothetical protein
MKKQYANPTLKVVFIEDADIVTESPQLSFDGEANYQQSNEAKRRNNIWDE